MTAGGRYLLHGHDGPYAVEVFTCGPDGDGWSYRARREAAPGGEPLGRLALRLDADGVLRRLHVEAGGWVVRGGCLGGQVLWRRGADERELPAAGFTGTSPGYAVATVRRLALAVGERRRLRLVAVTEPVLATRLVDQDWTRTGEDRWEAADLATGERRSVRVVDDVVVEGSGLTLTSG